MTNYRLKNTSDKAIKLTVKRTVKEEDRERELVEDYHVFPNEEISLSKLGGAHVDFGSNVDYTLRQKKALSEKFTFLVKTVKEKQENVNSVDLPELFTLLKVKKVHL